MKLYKNITDPDLIEDLVSGKVGVLPTDTVYGIACSARNPEAVQKLYTAKHREHKPGTLIAADVDQLVELGLKKRYLTPVEQYWPAAVSVVIPCGPELEYIHQGVQSLAVRIPAGKDLHELLLKTGPLLTSSANQPGHQPATVIKQAQDYLRLYYGL